MIKNCSDSQKKEMSLRKVDVRTWGCPAWDDLADCASFPSNLYNSYYTYTTMEMTDLEDIALQEEWALQEEINKEIQNTSTDDIINRTRLLENDIKVYFLELVL